MCLDWQIGDWTECSATCGHATQQRQVVCTNPGFCDISQRPEVTQPCEKLSPCIAWVYGDWSKCTKSCGFGVQERLVQCVNLSSQQLYEGCPSEAKPSERQECNGDECPADDNAGNTI
uniref:ADAMTS cysteine-rich domain-containing protein n=2 Tax=Arion vulgaris TaxID=1028688 RepID=A0A0B7BFC0_9EUPU